MQFIYEQRQGLMLDVKELMFHLLFHARNCFAIND